MADGNPFGSILNPNAARTGLWDLRMMSAANRMETPFERGMRSSYGRQGVSGDPMLAQMANMANEPDYSGFTYDPAMRQQAIAAGIQPLEAGQVKQNVLLPNTGFFGNHPMLSRALEAGLFGAAASHGGETVGQSIQGVTEGLIGGQRIREGLYRQQFARPFEAAGMLEGIRDRAQERELRAAQIKRFDNEADIQQQRIDLQRTRDLLRLEEKTATRPYTDPYGNTYMWQEGGPPELGPDALLRPSKPGWYKTGGPPEASVSGKSIRPETREYIAMAGGDPNNPTSDQIKAAHKQEQDDKLAQIRAGTSAREAATQPYKNLADAQKQHAERIRMLQSKLYKSDDPAHQKLIQEQADNDYMNRMMAGEKNLGPPKQLTPQEIQARIEQNNLIIQGQIDEENESFQQQYPEALETPKSKPSSPKRGQQAAAPETQAPKGSKENPHTF